MRKTILILIFLLIGIQFIQSKKTNPNINDILKLKAPKEVMSILKRACYDCHSNETIWPSYSYIAPISWSVLAHVNDGRKALNFSEYKNMDPKIRQKRLKRSIKTVGNAMMPLPSYLRFHDEAVLNNKDKDTLISWLRKELKK